MYCVPVIALPALAVGSVVACECVIECDSKEKAGAGLVEPSSLGIRFQLNRSVQFLYKLGS